jgi:hypothetical protein
LYKKDPGSKSHIWITLLRQKTSLHKISKISQRFFQDILALEDKCGKCTMILQNIQNHLPEAASDPRRPESSEYSCCKTC